MHTAKASRIVRLAAGLAVIAASMKGAQADACALLSPEAIRQQTGEQVANTKATIQSAGKLRLAQCFYMLPTFSNSISVTLTSPTGLSRDAARELWERWFHRDEDDKDKDHDRDKGLIRKAVKAESEEEEAAAKAEPVTGVGDEAWWVHSFVGNLYVRKGNRFLRISLGGKWSDDERQARAKALAKAALLRLQ